MRSPTFTPAQSRLLTAFVASYFLLTTSSNRHAHIFAYAAEVPAVSELDSTGQPVLSTVPNALTRIEDEGRESEEDRGYAPDFDYFDRSLLGRQETPGEPIEELKNNVMKYVEVNPGVTKHFVLKRGQSRALRSDGDTLEALEARADNSSEDAGDGKDEDIGLGKRQAGSRIWVTANTCNQPLPVGSEEVNNHPQLVLFVSTSAQNQRPDIDSPEGLVTQPTGVIFDKGFATFELNTTSSDIYIGVSAPNLEKDMTGSWGFDIAASFDGPYHSYNDTNPFLFMIDTDSESALFITYNLSDPGTNETDRWRNSNPFRMYAYPAEDRTNITGMEHSLCALKLLDSEKRNVTMKITTKFGGNLPKSQFHVQGLDTGKKYNGFLTVEGGDEILRLPGDGGIVRGGGKVFKQFNWTTKADDSCQVLFDLEFCDNVAYAVPSSPDFKFNDTKLAELYIDQAKMYYENFNRSLQQVACDTDSEAQYSLARTCKDCERDYKNWLCSVLMPRCEDWTATDSWLQERNVNALLPNGEMTFGNNISEAIMEEKRNRFAFSKSRNPMIDEKIKPGPYKEMKPCEDLCFDIVRSCPAQLGFACPNSPARELSYGTRDPEEKELRCNFPGAVVKLNVQGRGSRVGMRRWVVLGVVGVVVALLF